MKDIAVIKIIRETEAIVYKQVVTRSPAIAVPSLRVLWHDLSHVVDEAEVRLLLDGHILTCCDLRTGTFNIADVIFYLNIFEIRQHLVIQKQKRFLVRRFFEDRVQPVDDESAVLAHLI